jgi:hypothetical protein
MNTMNALIQRVSAAHGTILIDSREESAAQA